MILYKGNMFYEPQKYEALSFIEPKILKITEF